MTLLKIEGVTKSFGAVSVLHGVNLTVGAGEAIGLVGDNGAGKSTLMKIVTGIYQADDGAVIMDGEDMSPYSPGERRTKGIEMIYQDLALARQQDVAANILSAWINAPPAPPPISFSAASRPVTFSA